MLIDVHIHSDFSFDSEEKTENYLNKAKELGVPAIGFSEHYDYDAYLDGADIGLTDIPKYLSFMRVLKAEAAGQKILCGIELGYSKAAVEHYKEIAAIADFDYIINSVHTLPGYGDSYFPAYFNGRTTREAYSDYFKAVLDSVKAPYDYQIIGHIGYVSRYNSRDDGKIKYEDYADIIDEILTEIIRRDKCLEINTSVGKTDSSFLPDKDIIQRYFELGGSKLSFGSDAHKACDYLRNYMSVTEFLNYVGVTKLYYYKNRKPVEYKL